MKSMRGWKTITFNVALIGLALSDYLTATTGVFSAIFEDPKHATLAVTAIGLINVLLRLVTTGPVGKRERPDDSDSK